MSWHSLVCSMIWGGALASMAGCGGAVTVMDYHRSTLDTHARAHLNCEDGVLEVVDETPPDFQYNRDPEAGRYLVRGCNREARYLCYAFPEANVGAMAPECRRLGEEPSSIYIGPLPL